MNTETGIPVKLSTRLLGMFILLYAAIASQAMAAQQPIRIGATASLTGVYAAPGEDQLQGIRMWVHDINARGALLGRKVKLVSYDDRSDEETTRRLYRKLINDDKVDLLIGPYSSELTLVAAEVAEAHDFPMVAAGASSSRIWAQGYRNIFQVDAPAADYMALLLHAAQDNAGLNSIALVYPGTDFSREVAEGVRSMAAKRGMSIVYDREYSLDNTAFARLVSEMKAARPELVIGATYLDDSVAIVKESKRQDFSPMAMAFTVGPALTGFGDALGEDANGVLGVVSWMRSGNVPMAYDFSFRFKEQFGRNAGQHAAYGYAAAQVLEAGVRLAGSLDRDKLREQLGSMVFRSLLGNYRVDETGKQQAKSIYLMQWQNGYRLLVSPRELRDAPPIFPFTPWSER